MVKEAKREPAANVFFHLAAASMSQETNCNDDEKEMKRTLRDEQGEAVRQLKGGAPSRY